MIRWGGTGVLVANVKSACPPRTSRRSRRRAFGVEPEHHDVQEARGRLGQRTEPVPELAPGVLDLGRRPDARQPLVEHEALADVGDVVVGQVGAAIGRRISRDRPRRATARRAAPRPPPRAAPGTRSKPTARADPYCSRAEQVARAADLEVAVARPEAGAELRELLERLAAALRRRLVERLVARHEQVGVRAVAAAADAAAQLVELREAERVGAVDEDRVDARDVEAALDDRRAEQHVDVAAHERQHRSLELALRHLAVRHATRTPAPSALEQLGDRRRCDWTRLWTKNTCPPRPQLAQDRLADHATRRSGDDLAPHREPVGRRRLDHRQVAEPAHRHLQRARDRRRGQRQHVDVAFRAASAAPCAPRRSGAPRRRRAARGRLKRDVLREQAVRADHDVDRPLREPVQHRLLLRRATGSARASRRARDRSRSARGRCRSAAGRAPSSGTSTATCLPVHHDAEGRAHRDLGLAVADVAADEPVHRPRRSRSAEHVLDRRDLVGRLLVRERRLELVLHGVVARREREALRDLALRVQAEQLLRHVPERGPHRLLVRCQVAPPSLSSRGASSRSRCTW